MTGPVGGVGSTSPTAAQTATSSVDRADQMGKDTFLQLLVAQMRYQDPSSPTSTTEFMSQTATFTQVEKLEEIASQNAADRKSTRLNSSPPISRMPSSA